MEAETAEVAAAPRILWLGAGPDENLLRALHPAQIRRASDVLAAATVLHQQPRPSVIAAEFSMATAEFCGQLRLDPLTRDIPILMLAPTFSEEDEQKALHSGATDLALLPCSAQLLAMRLKNLMTLSASGEVLEARVAQRTRDLAEAKHALELQNRAREKVIARADFLVNYDPLTSLPNRRHMMERLAAEHAHVAETGGSLGLLMVNLDRFHVVNSALGNAAGDRLLVACAERLEPCLGRTDVLGRLGGDEFMVLLLGAGFGWNERAEQVEKTGRKVLEMLSQPFQFEGRKIEITSSVGYSVFPGDGDTAGELHRRAAAALHHAKQSGRNLVEGYRPEFDVGATLQYHHESLIRQALKEHALRPYFQPKVDMDTGQVTGAEALVRWPQADGHTIGAVELLRMAEDAQLLDALEDEMLEMVFEQVARWSPRLPRHFRIAVNLSPARFRRESLVAQLKNLIEQTGANPRQIEVEITESALIGNIEAAIARMRALRSAGFTISLDDFGTGYSSLSHLKRLPLDTLKIDQHFIRDINKDPRDAAIVQAIVTLAHNMRLNTVVEGVETEEQRAAVLKEDCHTAQGYLYSKPVSAAEFETILDSQILQPAKEQVKNATSAG